MIDNLTTLDALVSAARPFKPFSMEIGDVKAAFYARKPSAAEQAEINSMFNHAYSEKRNSLINDDSELALFRRSLAKQKIEDLAEYIVSADNAEFDSEASRLLEKPPEDKAVKKKAKELRDARKAELMASSLDDIIPQALERREHIQAFIHATQAIIRVTVAFCTYDLQEKRLFPTVDDVDRFPESLIAEFSNKIDEVLNVKAPETSPLKPAPSTP